MNCEEFKHRSIEYSLGQLTDQEELDFRAHLDTGCEHCGELVVELQAAWSDLAVDLTIIEPSSKVEEELMARIACEKATTAPVIAVEGSQALMLSRYQLFTLITAASLLGVVCSAFVVRFVLSNQKVEESIAASDHLGAPGSIPESDATIRTVNFESRNSESTGNIQILWDMASEEWHVLLKEMPPNQDGSVYILWIRRDSGSVEKLTSLNVTNQHVGGAVVAVPEQANEIRELFVTQEANSEVQMPSRDADYTGNLN